MDAVEVCEPVDFPDAVSRPASVTDEVAAALEAEQGTGSGEGDEEGEGGADGGQLEGDGGAAGGAAAGGGGAGAQRKKVQRLVSIYEAACDACVFGLLSYCDRSAHSFSTFVQDIRCSHELCPTLFGTKPKRAPTPLL